MWLWERHERLYDAFGYTEPWVIPFVGKQGQRDIALSKLVKHQSYHLSASMPGSRATLLMTSHSNMAHIKHASSFHPNILHYTAHHFVDM